jgi:predicted PurR-regulated permease PerM
MSRIPPLVTVNITLRSMVLTLAVLGLVYVATLIPALLLVALIALILASALAPVVNVWQARFGLSRPVAVVAIFASVFGTLLLLALLITPSLVSQSRTLAAEFPSYVNKLRGTYNWLQGLDATYHVLPDIDNASRQIASIAGDALTRSLGWAGQILGGVATLGLVLITTFYLLLEGPSLKQGALRLIPPDHRAVMDAQFEPITTKLGGYVRGVAISIGFLTCYLAIALSAAGVPLALALALIAGLLELIPMVGSLLGSIPTILIALTVSWKLALIVVAIFSVGNLIQGNLVAPYVFARAVAISPLLIMFALLIGGQLMGIAGALIAVPVLAMIQVLIQNLYVEPMERQYQALQTDTEPSVPEPDLANPHPTAHDASN